MAAKGGWFGGLSYLTDRNTFIFRCNLFINRVSLRVLWPPVAGETDGVSCAARAGCSPESRPQTMQHSSRRLCRWRACRREFLRASGPLTATNQDRSGLHFSLAHRGPEASCARRVRRRSEEHTSELQSRRDLVCRLLLQKKKKISYTCSLFQKKKKKK